MEIAFIGSVPELAQVLAQHLTNPSVQAPDLSEQDAVLKLNHRLRPVLRMFLKLFVKRFAAVHVRAIFDKLRSSSSLNLSNRFHCHDFAPPLRGETKKYPATLPDAHIEGPYETRPAEKQQFSLRRKTLLVFAFNMRKKALE